MENKTELPLTLRLPMPFEAHVYPSPEGGRGVTVRGPGYITLTFEGTKDTNIAEVHIEDIWLKLPSTRIPFDIDRDGQLECIDLEGFTLGAEAFDLERSGGKYDLESGHIALNFAFSIDPDSLMPFGIKLDLSPIRFELTERGWLDLKSGRFSTHSDLVTVPEGPFSGLTIMGHQGDGEITTCNATVAIGVGILSAGPPALDIPAGQAPKEVWICPETPIALLWDSTKADNVEIKPDVGLRLPNGYQQIPDPSSSNPDLHRAIDRNMVYTADTVGGGCLSAHDKVSINVVEDGDEIPQSAEYNREYGYWVAHLPNHTYDQNIKVDRVIIDTGKPDSVTHPNWRHDHIYTGEPPVGTVIPSLNNWQLTSSEFSLPGEHRFTPQPPGTTFPSGEEELTLYFRLRIKCIL